MRRNALDRLHELATFVGAAEDLPTHLRQLVDLTAAVANASICSIMLLSEGNPDSPRLKLWCATDGSPVWNETSEPARSMAARVLAQSATLLIPDIGSSDFAPLAMKRSDLVGASFICTPILVGKDVIGVMSLESRPASPPFDQSDLRLAEIVATLIGKSVQVERLQTLIRSRVAHLSLAREEKEVVARLTDGTVPPARIAKLLAKSFFRDLASAGFEPGQIIEAASEIITQVSNDISRYKRRMQRKTT